MLKLIHESPTDLALVRRWEIARGFSPRSETAFVFFASRRFPISLLRLMLMRSVGNSWVHFSTLTSTYTKLKALFSDPSFVSLVRAAQHSFVPFTITLSQLPPNSHTTSSLGRATDGSIPAEAEEFFFLCLVGNC